MCQPLNGSLLDDVAEERLLDDVRIEPAAEKRRRMSTGISSEGDR